MRKPSLLDPSFKYVKASETNIAKTFARVRKEQAQEAAANKAVVTPIKGRKQK